MKTSLPNKRWSLKKASIGERVYFKKTPKFIETDISNLQGTIAWIFPKCATVKLDVPIEIQYLGWPHKQFVTSITVTSSALNYLQPDNV